MWSLCDSYPFCILSVTLWSGNGVGEITIATVFPVNPVFDYPQYGEYGIYGIYLLYLVWLIIRHLTKRLIFLRTHSQTSSKSPQKSVARQFLPENQCTILNYSAWRKWRLWRNGGEVSATSAIPPHVFVYSRLSYFLKKVFECRKFCSKQCHFNFHSRHASTVELLTPFQDNHTCLGRFLFRFYKLSISIVEDSLSSLRVRL